MEANAGKLIELLKGETKRFIIPLYQREYSWKMKDCETLIMDLQESADHDFASHFFGSIVFHTKNVGKLTNYYLIDGQQRVSTVFILLIAIKNISTELQYQSIDSTFIENDILFDKKENKLEMSLNDKLSLDKIINNSFKKNESQLISNYCYFYAKLSEMDEKNIFDIYEAIKKLEIVFISLDIDKGDKPQLIFESLNSKGVKLSEADKIRNFVLMNNDSDKLDNIYNVYWYPLESMVGKDKLNVFFRNYLAKCTCYLPNEDKLYVKFKEYRENNFKDIESLMKNVMVYAGYYNIIINTKCSDKGYKGSIGRIIYLDINTSIPLIFDFFDAQKSGLLSNAEFDEAMDILESYYTRRVFCVEEVSSLNKTFVSIGKEIHDRMLEYKISYIDAFKYAVLSRSGKTRFPKDSEFNERFASFELYNSKSKFKKYVFERLENLNVKAPDMVVEYLDNGTYTIEHIMPQTLSNEWKKYLGKDWDKISSKYLHTIGNLTITEYNSEYGNLIFDKKKNLPEKGFSFSKIHINKDISNCERWDENAIKHHASEMLNKANKIWKYPKLPIIIENNYETLSLEDDINFNDYKMRSIKIIDEEIDASNFEDAFKKLCLNLYALDSLKYSKHNCSFHSKSPKIFRKALELNSNLYVKLDGNITSKVEYLRNIVLHLGFDLDDIEFILEKKEKFDILKENTYCNAKAGEFAKEAFKYLFNHELLSDSDIQQLLDLKTSKEIFPKSVYCALSLDVMTGVTANKNGIKTRRYYSEPIMYKGEKYFISSQWYPNTKEGLVAYFNKMKDF